MPDSRSHRGPHPRDRTLFSEKYLGAIRAGVSDLSWLLSKGYAPNAGLKLVGDRYRLQKRQRTVVLRSSCSDTALSKRKTTEILSESLRGSLLAIDAFNCIITVEAALSGALVFRGRDGALRDLASVHGSYRRVEETQQAIEAIAAAIEQSNPSSVLWLLDKPVSNSGRLAGILRAHNPRWDVELVMNPDKELLRLQELSASSFAIASGDAWILDNCRGWHSLACSALAEHPCWQIDLQDNTDSGGPELGPQG